MTVDPNANLKCHDPCVPVKHNFALPSSPYEESFSLLLKEVHECLRTNCNGWTCTCSRDVTEKFHPALNLIL